MSAPITREKRWRRGRQVWTTPPQRFAPSGYAVDVLPERQARAFIEEHHYSHSFPAARLSVGMFGPGVQLVGVAVLSVPMNQQVLPARTGHRNADAAELGRFVCAPSVLFNGETWFLSRAFRFAREEKGIRAVLSYADPVPQHDAAGGITKAAHWGTIYQARSGTYVGRSDARTLLVARDGTVISGRALTKLRRRERGWQYAERQLVDAGAPTRGLGEAPAEWVRRASAAPCFRRVRHPGNHAYVFGLTEGARAILRRLHGAGEEYPRPALLRGAA